MAFTTEFVMGAGGAEIEEIPVSMSGGGHGNVYPLTTVDAGAGAWVWVSGTINSASTGSAGAPQIQVGPHLFTVPYSPAAGGGYVTGSAAVAIVSRHFNTTTFTGTVYVYRL